MSLWIIYNDGIIISKIIAELLEEQLEDYIDVSVGNIKKINPIFLTEEKVDYLILGDIISETIPSIEIRNWVLKFEEVSIINNISIKSLSGFCIELTEIKNKAFWVEHIQGNINAEIIYPPILNLKVNSPELALEIGVLEIVIEYSYDFIGFLLNDKKKGEDENIFYFSVEFISLLSTLLI